MFTVSIGGSHTALRAFLQSSGSKGASVTFRHRESALQLVEISAV